MTSALSRTKRYRTGPEGASSDHWTEKSPLRMRALTDDRDIGKAVSRDDDGLE
jgi:hypothetical protein